jgi:hypothetical protein
VSANTQALDQRTLEVIAGAEYAKKPFAVRYQHGYRTFEDSSQDLTYEYTNPFGNFDLGGVQPFAVVPDNTRNTDVGMVRVDLNSMASAMGKVRMSKVENDNTGYSLETTSFSGRVNITPSSLLSLRGRFDYLDTTNDVPFSASREATRFSGRAIFRPIKAIRLEGRYRWEKMERTGGTEIDETTTESFRLKAVWRPDRTIRVVASHSFVDRENPYGRVLRNSFSRIDDVVLSPFGMDQDVTDINVLYTPSDKVSLNGIYHRTHAEENDQNVESTLQYFSASASYKAADNYGFYGVYSHYSNEYEREIYLGVLAPYLTVTPLPYEGTGDTFTVGGWIWTGTFSIRPSWNYTASESSFDDGTIGSGLTAINETDVAINRLVLEFEMPITDNLDINLGYYQDKYEDDARPQDDGTVHWFYGWLGYKF